MTHEKKVKYIYPNANLLINSDGFYYIDDGNGNNLNEEFFFPKSKEKDIAWEYALNSIKLTKFMNRTHPNRLVLDNKKTRRNIARRKINNREFL